MKAEKATPAQDMTKLPRRFLNAVEPLKPRHGFEIACAFGSRPLRISLAALAGWLFLGAWVDLATMPIGHK